MSPPDDELDQYLCRKFFPAINALITAGASGRIFNCVSDWPGSAHDNKIFKNSNLFQELENGWRPFKGAKILADSAFYRQLLKLSASFLTFGFHIPFFSSVFNYSLSIEFIQIFKTDYFRCLYKLKLDFKQLWLRSSTAEGLCALSECMVYLS